MSMGRARACHPTFAFQSTESIRGKWLSQFFIAPFSLGADPASNGFKVRDLNLPGGVDDKRFARRRSALDAVNQYFVQKDKSDGVKAMSTFYGAYNIVSSPEAAQHSI